MRVEQDWKGSEFTSCFLSLLIHHNDITYDTMVNEGYML